MEVLYPGLCITHTEGGIATYAQAHTHTHTSSFSIRIYMYIKKVTSKTLFSQLDLYNLVREAAQI